jgi:hypothetical protein
MATVRDGDTYMIRNLNARLEVPAVATVKVSVFLGVTPCSLVEFTNVSEEHSAAF